VEKPVATVDLRALDLAPGAAARLAVRVPPVRLRLGGQEHRVEPETPEVRLDVSRSLTGLHLRLRAAAELVGPCWRCLEEACAPVELDVSEMAAEGRPADAPFDDDLDSVYVQGDLLDLGQWFRDAVAEAVPATLLCREDCAGLCPVCGANRNEVDCGCAPEEGDARWEPLRELAERLQRGEPGG
jgi:uncharacterized protein